MNFFVYSFDWIWCFMAFWLVRFWVFKIFLLIILFNLAYRDIWVCKVRVFDDFFVYSFGLKGIFIDSLVFHRSYSGKILCSLLTVLFSNLLEFLCHSHVSVPIQPKVRPRLVAHDIVYYSTPIISLFNSTKTKNLRWLYHSKKKVILLVSISLLLLLIGYLCSFWFFNFFWVLCLLIMWLGCNIGSWNHNGLIANKIDELVFIYKWGML